MSRLSPEALRAGMMDSHERERALIDGLTEDQVRASSALPGWTRGHVLGARLAFARAVNRQLDYALTDRAIGFVDGGVAGRDAYIETQLKRPAGELVRAVQDALVTLDRRWSELDPADLRRPAMYRGPCRLLDILQACWRESEIHCVDLDLGVRPTAWSAEFCAELFEFLEQRVPDGVRLELVADNGGTWTMGAGEVVQVRGALTDLAAWLSGRDPMGPLASSTGALPELGGLRSQAHKRPDPSTDRRRLHAPARVEGREGAGQVAKPIVLFLCLHNAGRSQIALGFFQQLAGDRAIGWSGGAEPGDQLHPTAVAAMRERGIDITGEYPKSWTEEMLRAADVVVTMGCACPVLPDKRYLDWEFDEPAGRSIEAIRPVRDEIERRVRHLLDELNVPVA